MDRGKSNLVRTRGTWRLHYLISISKLISRANIGARVRETERGGGGALANSDARKNGEEVIAKSFTLVYVYRGRAIYVQRLAYEYELRIALANASACFSGLYGAAL